MLMLNQACCALITFTTVSISIRVKNKVGERNFIIVKHCLLTGNHFEGICVFKGIVYQKINLQYIIIYSLSHVVPNLNFERKQGFSFFFLYNFKNEPIVFYCKDKIKSFRFGAT